MPGIFSLNDADWFVGAVAPRSFPAASDYDRVQGWLPATVPGDVRLDLLRVGKIPDPFLGKNNEASQWIDGHDWWYRRQAIVEDAPHARHFLVFEGIDYRSAVHWNGVELGTHTGMFSRQIYEIPREQLNPGANLLAVRVWGASQLPRPKLGARELAWRLIAGRTLPHAAHAPEFPERYATLKCQMSYGWDFAPRLLTCGIWDDASLIQTGEVMLRDVRVVAVPDGRATVTLDLDTRVPRELLIRFKLTGKNFASVAQTLEIPLKLHESGAHSFPLVIEDPRLWQAWDRGEPNLYNLQVTVLDGGEESDASDVSFGLRSIELGENPGAHPDAAPWTFTLNGEPEFIRGANWVPADAIPARVTAQDYRALLEMARDANINLLRVWGGGLREKRTFYDICDELGIMVWQEFPFSGSGVDYFPRDPAYLALASQECEAIVSALRNHPSLVLWCGGNEFIPRANRRVVDVMRAAVARHDGTRPFKPASPSPGESHNWRVWHGGANTRDYEKDDALFFGEFGLQSAPDLETLTRFLPESELFPPNDWWDYHNAERAKLWRYAIPVLSAQGIENCTPEQFVAASQEAQLRGLQIAIEHARRSKPRVSGCLFWQFNEPWYSICWSVVDYARAPKRAYAKIKELYNPVLVSFAYPRRERAPGELVSGQLWLINDTLLQVNGLLSGWHNDALVLERDVELAPNSARVLQDLDLAPGAGSNTLRFELRGDAVLATNEYDLNYSDSGEIDLRRAALTDAAAWLRTRT
jgi:beta-mannosidase